MPSQGSTTKKCVVCHAQLYVACKTCKTCKAEQPPKLRLRKKMEKFDQKRESWVHTHQKNRTTSHIRDEAYMLLEKLHALGVRAVLLLSRPGRKKNAWVSEVLAPRCKLTETSRTCLQRMKDLYDIVIQGWTPQDASGQQEEPSSAPLEPPTGSQMVPTDPQVAMALLVPSTVPTGILAASTGPPAAPIGPLIGQPASLIGPSAHHAISEQRSQNLGKGQYSPEGPPATSQVCLEKDGQREIKTETESSPTPVSAPASSSPDIKLETGDIGLTSDHPAHLSSCPVLSVTVTDTGFFGDMEDDWEEREETGHCRQKEKERRRREMGPEMQIYRPTQRGTEEESTEAMCVGPPTKPQSVLAQCKYENTAASTSGHEAAQLQAVTPEKRVPQTARTPDITHTSYKVEAPPSRPSNSCDLDSMDLDQLRREKIKMQIKVLRLQEEYYTQKLKGHRT
ncbi:uncharacterized protein LOC121621303 [Chelmon rostratus]|uniref:uncharacterized protein LOC121621303 n=1 Tax=Chelmon rostratus TaxID=109905 RepID=UPI001BE8C4DB|nr:uncharacterized protein LOC121621303 [Chelmon rostratus]XP_041813654.1 uncharacterized protein LOC121621303 [Chelmon rostratus]